MPSTEHRNASNADDTDKIYDKRSRAVPGSASASQQSQYQPRPPSSGAPEETVSDEFWSLWCGILAIPLSISIRLGCHHRRR